jgi:hypothetical protein
MLRGVGHAVNVFTPCKVERESIKAAIARRITELGHSDAENVLLLHRDDQQRKAAAE